MDIHSVQFVKGVIGSEGLPQPSLPVVAFFGRSNVGKSSVINSLVKQKGMARSSSSAGRTTEINYYLVNDAWYLVDLPGYGYANRPAVVRAKLEKHLSWYASTDEVNFLWTALIVDAEIGAKDSDKKTFELLREYGRRVIIIANKCDKGGRNDMTKSLQKIRTTFPDCPVIRYSAKTGEGRIELLQTLFPKEKK
ncbi:MAG: ribosome biogenesis GTP-binding protein YihA/YsxC [Candidatus Moranbacteria bacterium]|nr:ribosome biogenesis GTP-binding protein YihA/YsxC [Candidatus Moranbacteria bacterium]MDD3964892.1 ribosome biogenesis GTP-binding protein YihA/YsxC [Candidatus Moranbacteria bacterium]